jgi:hypothetical protein
MQRQRTTPWGTNTLKSLGQVQIRLLDLDAGLPHRSTQGIVQDRDLGAGQLHAAPDEQEHEQEHEEEAHRAIG